VGGSQHHSPGPNIQRGWQIMNLTLPYCIAIADRGPIWRSAVRQIILEIPGIEIVGETGSHQELFHLLGSKKLDLIILDIPDFFDEIQKIKTFYPSIKILVLSINHSLQSTHDALSAGVDGYLLKSDTDTELIAAIKKLRLDGSYISSSVYNHFMEIVKIVSYKESQFSGLSVREKQIIALIVEGGSSKEIAEQLSISHRTVHCHRANIIKKLGLKRTNDLIKLWLIEDHRIQN
jgi:DNA-binding NarL/FixJ family response regulator